MKKFVFLFSAFVCLSFVLNAQETSVYWQTFKASYVQDLKQGLNGFSQQTEQAGQKVINESANVLESKMVEYVLGEERVVDEASAHILAVHPKKISDSLKLILAMNASYGQSPFLSYFNRFNELYHASIIPNWYIEDLVESVPAGKWLVTSGQLETYQVKAQSLKLNKDLKILEINVLNKFDSSKGLSDYASKTRDSKSLKEWLVRTGSQQTYLSLLLQSDLYSDVKSNLYVQGLTLLYSVSPWTDQQVNQRLINRVKNHLETKSPFLNNYLPMLYSLQKSGVKTETYIRQIEK